MVVSDWLNAYYEVLTDLDNADPNRLIQIAAQFETLYPSVTNRAGLLMAILYEVATGVSHLSQDYLYLYNPAQVLLERTRDAVNRLPLSRSTCPYCGRSDGIVGFRLSVPLGEVDVRCTHCINEEVADGRS